MNQLKRLWIVIVAAMALLLTACGGGGDSGGETSADGCAKPEKFVFDLAATFSYSTSLYAIAKEKGWYEDACLDVEFRQGSGSQNLVQLMGAGSANIGEADAVSVMAGQAAGAAINAIGLVTQQNMFALLIDDAKLTAAQKDERPFDLKSLYGMTYGATESGSADLVLTYLMKINDIDRNKIPRVSIPLPGLAPLVTGQVDFVANFATQAPLVEAEGKKVAVITAKDMGMDAVGYILVGNDDYLASHGDQVERFLAATKRAMEYAPSHTEEGARDVCKIAPQLCAGDKTDIVAKQFGQYASFYKSPSGGYMCIDGAAWDATKELVKNTSLQADKVPDVSKAKYTNEYLEGC